jgi:hypothetical protein
VLWAGYLSLAVAAVLGPVAGDGEAAPKPVQVEFDAPEACSGAEAFLSTVRSRTERVRQAVGSEPRTTLQVRLTRIRGQVLGELRLIDDRGGTDTRKVQGASCDDVVQALSLTAALALDPSAVTSTSTAPATTPAAAASTTASTNTSPVASTAASTTASPVTSTAAPPTLPTPRAPAAPPIVAPDLTARVSDNTPHPDDGVSSDEDLPVPKGELGAGVGGTTLLAGSLSPSVTLVARKNLDGDGVFRPSLGLAVSYVRNDVWQSPRSVKASLAAAGGSLCPLRWTASVVAFQPCALVVAGWLSASGYQLTHTSTVGRLWLSAGAALRMAVLLGQALSLEAELGFTAPLLKRRFYATVPSDVVAETPSLSPLVGVALTYGLQ